MLQFHASPLATDDINCLPRNAIMPLKDVSPLVIVLVSVWLYFILLLHLASAVDLWIPNTTNKIAIRETCTENPNHI